MRGQGQVKRLEVHNELDAVLSDALERFLKHISSNFFLLNSIIIIRKSFMYPNKFI